MERRDALRLLAAVPITTAMTLRELGQLSTSFPTTPRMPVLFLGHGSPMNAIEDNAFSRSWQALGRDLPRPSAILCISAHWETNGGTYVTAMDRPRTIHDFGGFPQALFDVQYPAPGSPELVRTTQQAVTSKHIAEDHRWGLDHGAWSVIMHLFPKADVPVVQLSLDRDMSPQQHYALAQELRPLRERGILIVGSGNMVHNLGMIDWNNPEGGFDWAVEANEGLKAMIQSGDHARLADHRALGRAFQLSVPTPEHYLPLLYTLGLQATSETPTIFNDRLMMGSLSMTSLRIGG